MPPLKNIRHENFVLAYRRLKGDGQQAVLDAGFHVKTLKEGSTSASVTANRLLKNSKIVARLRELQDKDEAAFVVNKNRVLQEMARVAFQSSHQLYDRKTGKMKPLHELDDDAAATIAGVEYEELFGGKGKGRSAIGRTIKLKRWDKNAMLEALAQHVGIYDEKDKATTQVMNIQFVLPHNARDPLEAQAHDNGSDALALPDNGRGS